MAVHNEQHQITLGPAAAVTGADVWYTRFGLPGRWRFASVHLMPNNAQTANGTNFATYTLARGATTVATRSYAATDSVAGTAEALTPAAGVEVVAGDIISWTKADSGTGLAGHNTCDIVLERVA